jgi:hypothetical protein
MVHLFSTSSVIYGINDLKLYTLREAKAAAPRDLVARTYEADTKKVKVRGQEEHLKESQTYPVLFGAQFAKLVMDNTAQLQQECHRPAPRDAISLDDLFGPVHLGVEPQPDLDLWPGAKLDSVMVLAVNLVRHAIHNAEH